MAGRGFAPKDPSARRNRAAPSRGEWQSAPIGWQHGEIPEPPRGLLRVSRDTWRTWFAGWFAGQWDRADATLVRIAIRLFDDVERGKFERASELRHWEDNLGITPKGAAERRWVPPRAAFDVDRPPVASIDAYRHLRGPDDQRPSPS